MKFLVEVDDAQLERYCLENASEDRDLEKLAIENDSVPEMFGCAAIQKKIPFDASVCVVCEDAKGLYVLSIAGQPFFVVLDNKQANSIHEEVDKLNATSGAISELRHIAAIPDYLSLKFCLGLSASKYDSTAVELLCETLQSKGAR